MKNVSLGVAPSSNNVQLVVGGRNNAAEKFWKGAIDEVKIWNRALSSSEILDEYNNIQSECTVDSDCSLGNYCFSESCYLNEDVNNDTKIDFVDLVSVAQYVITDNCNLQNNWCNRRDINHDTHADFIDMVSVAIKM